MTAIIVLLGIVAIVEQGAVVVLLWRSRPRPATPAIKQPHWDSDVRDSRIAAAIREQLAYEEEHAERQAKRLKHIKHDRHGQYDDDQRAHSVLLKVRKGYADAGEVEPPELAAAVAGLLREESAE